MYIFSCFREFNIQLYSSCVIANLPSFLIGYCIAWTTFAIPRLDGTVNQLYSPLKTSVLLHHKIWLISVIPIGIAISSLLSAYLINKRGRKELLVLATLFTTMGLALVYFSEYITYLLIGRAVCGLGIGAALTVVPLYIAEIAEDENRGFLGMCNGIFVILGMLITYALGLVMTLNELNLMFFVVAFGFLLIVDWWLPESYHWLLLMDRSKDAEISLKQIRRYSNDDLINELIVTKKSIGDLHLEDMDFLNIFKQRYILKAFCTMCGLMLFQQMITVSIILYYAQSLFTESDMPQQLHLAQLTISFVQLLSCSFFSLFVDKIGRKILLLVSTIGCGLSLVTLGTFFQIQNSGNILQWLEITSIICFAIAHAAGLGPVPFVILGEIFSPQTRAIGSAGVVCMSAASFVLMAAVFLPLLNLIGEVAMFWVLAGICFIFGAFIYFYIPETKRKSLQDIQDMLQN
ncbi:hypothetical protein Trydic_g13673 [Trypoxylus dichotomus]